MNPWELAHVVLHPCGEKRKTNMIFVGPGFELQCYVSFDPEYRINHQILSNLILNIIA